ncbi:MULTISPECIES: AraC family transcriptional regulator [Sphingomonadales]|uniref:Regulatory protein SoxS n=1 Tax=Edaphosphingomonas haloaromaticamans TaxID=653954 RepID=A0A1S1HE37_9SPHN|nr:MULTISPECIES: AraC family transcriptional regulator [Sphingomonas]MDX3884705.1 AraC family transcriptional regulator [Sphingomonas sp.]OHT19766.1 Regulatory protein SoxS [Sphingomonas haloaromaticamans]
MTNVIAAQQATQSSTIHVDAAIVAPNCTIQIVSAIHPTPVEYTHCEPHHAIAMQRQRKQAFSTGRYLIEGAEKRFEDIGRVLVLPANVPLEVRAEGGPTQAVRCIFNQDAYARITGLDELVHPNEMVGCLDVKSPRITDTLARLAGEAEAPGFASRVLAEALGTSLMVEIARYVNDLQPRSTIQRGGLARRTHRQIIEYVETQNGTPSLSDLAKLTGLSRRHLSRAFKQTTGQTIYDYVEQVRFNRAANMLADTDLLIKDIAFKLGFTCSSSFSVAFRRACGETPKSFRKRMRPGAPDEIASPLSLAA